MTSRSDWFAIIRSGVLEHMTWGKLGFDELGIYTTIHLQANFSTGIWWGSAPKLQAAAPRGTSLREIQRSLENLVDIRFIRSFHERGARGNYPILIDKYDVKVGALKGKRLNAWNSMSWEEPLYEPCAEGDVENDAEDAPIQEVRIQEIRNVSPIAVTSSIQNSLSVESQDHQRAREPHGFLSFVEQYPRHRLGVQAEVFFEWTKIPPAEQNIFEIITGLQRWKSSSEWAEQGGRFVPKAKTFLAAKLWSIRPRGQSSHAESFEEKRIRESREAINRVAEKYSH